MRAAAVLCLALAAAPGAAAQASPWTVTASRSEMTDEPTVIVSQPSERTVVGPAGAPVRPVLFVRCREGVMAAGILPAGLVPDRDRYGRVAVRVRWDTYEAVSAEWTAGDDLAAVWIPDTLRLDFILNGMVPARRLRLGVDMFRRGEVVLEYSMAGFARLLPRLKAACPDAWHPRLE